jgi:hypothetical protein
MTVEGKRRWDGWLGPKQWVPIVAILAVAVIVLSVLLGLGVGADAMDNASTAVTAAEATHQHADFALFIEGKEFNFDQPQFISTADKDTDPYVHIHEPRPTIVHVHKLGITWDYFFHSLGFKLDDPSFPAVAAASPANTCLTIPSGQKYCQTATETFKFYVNGVKVDGVSNTGIHDLDRVLISYGSESEADVVANQLTKVTDQACIPSERCKSRIPAGEPPELCTTSNNCVKPGG